MPYTTFDNNSKNLQEYNKKLIDFNLAIISHLKKNKEYNSLLDTIVTQFSLLFDFDIGHFYAYDSYQDQLKSSNIFYLKSAHKHKVFVQVTKKSAFKKGSGLPGSAWEKRKVIYYPDITQSKNFPRTHQTKASLNIKGGIALPVFYDDKLLGVAEFFSIQKLTLSHDEMVLFERFSTLINGLYGQYQEHRTLNLILENCGEGIYGLDNKGMTTFVNPPACKMLGYTEAELIGCSMHEKIHYAYPDKRPYLRDFCKVYECISLCKSFYVDDEVFWTKEGKPLPIEYTVTPIIENKNTLGAVVTFIDISEKRKVKSHLKFISELQARYISGLNRNTLFDDILDYLIECTESKYGFIGAVLKDKKDKPFLKTYAITNIAWNKKMQQLYEQSILLNGGIEFRNLKTLFGYTLRTGNVVISNDPNHDKRAGGLPKGHPALDNYLGIPIFSSEGDLVAMYGLSNRKAGYSQEIVDDLEILTRAISSMIESSHQYKIIQEMARLDPLTNIYNRQYFDIALNQALETHHEKKQSFCILMLGLDKFKNINDTYGHQISDEILILFAKRIKKILKKDDIIARLGGDEFICILHNTNNNTYTHNLTHRILKAGETAYKIQGKSIYCGVTIGIVYYPEGGKTAATLLKHVDFSLYDAKKNKHKWQVYSKGIDTQYLSLLKLEKTLEDAFLNESFYLSYQPQIELKTKKIIGLEALLRLKDMNNKEISPGIFIPMLEKFGHADRLNQYVVAHVLKDALTLENKVPLKIAINISPKVIKIDSHIEVLVNMVKAHQEKLNQKRILIEFEITESSFTHGNFKLLRKALNMTKKAGITCAMDDFGVEYSSISRLTEFSFDMVKIDQFFIQKLDKKNGKLSKAVIKVLVQLAEDLGFVLLAEGAETKKQVHHLIELGCEYVQGFYYYKPMPIKSINQIIK